MRRKAALALAAVGTAGVFHLGARADVVWTGAGGTTLFDDNANWSGGNAPLDPGAQVVTFGSNAPASLTRMGWYNRMGASQFNFATSGDMTLWNTTVNISPNATPPGVPPWTGVGHYVEVAAPANMVNVTTPHRITIPGLAGYRAWNAPPGRRPAVIVNVVPGAEVAAVQTIPSDDYDNDADYVAQGGGKFTIGSATGALNDGHSGAETWANITQKNNTTVAIIATSYNNSHMWGMLTSSGGTVDITQHDASSTPGVRFVGGSTSGISPGLAAGETAKINFTGATGSAILVPASGAKIVMDITSSATAGTTFDQLALSSVALDSADLANVALTVNVADYQAGGTPVSVPIITGAASDYSGISSASFLSVTGLPAGATISGTAGGTLYVNYTEAPVPEPGALGLLALGGLAVLARRRRPQT